MKTVRISAVDQGLQKTTNHKRQMFINTDPAQCHPAAGASGSVPTYQQRPCPEAAVPLHTQPPTRELVSASAGAGEESLSVACSGC